MKFLCFGFFIKMLLLVPLEVSCDNFVFCQKFVEILAKILSQRCMTHGRTATPRCIIHRKWRLSGVSYVHH